MGFMSVVEALRLAPGVLVRRSEMKSIVSIRGTGDFPYNNRVLFLLDGVPINSPDTGTYPGFPMDHLIPIEEVERIEVYKGPGSAIFGPGAFEGTVNIVPKRGPIRHQRRGLNSTVHSAPGESKKQHAGSSYTCSMCGGDFEAMGPCPKCGMALINVEEPAHKGGELGLTQLASGKSKTQRAPQVSYTCTMCGGSFEAIGPCPKCGMTLIKVEETLLDLPDKATQSKDRHGIDMLHLMASPEGEPMATLTHGVRDGDLDYSLTLSGMLHKGDLEVQEDFEHRIVNAWLSAGKGPWSSILNYMYTESTPFAFRGGPNAADEIAFHAQGGIDMMAHPERADIEFDTLGTREQLLYWFGKFDKVLNPATRLTAQASFQYRQGTTCAACHTGTGTTDSFSLARVPWAGQRDLIKDELQETYRTFASVKLERSMDWPVRHDLTVKVDTTFDLVDRDIMVTQNGVDKDQFNAGVTVIDRMPLLDDRLWMTVGGRWDHLDYVDDELSWHAGMTARPLNGLDIGLTVRSGFRAPTWDERFSAFVIMSEIPASVMGTKETGAKIQSEKIKSIELNASLQLSSNLMLRFDGYYSQVSDFIDRTAPPRSYKTVPPPMIFTWGNAEEEIDIRGFELSLDFVPSHRLWFTLGWAYQQTDTPPPPKGFAFGEWPYRGPPYAPQNTIKFQAYTEPLEGLTFNFSLGWFDERFVQFHMYANPAVYHNWADTARVNGEPLGSYSVADASIAYRLPVKEAHVQIGLLIADLFNERPFEYKHHPEDPSHGHGREFTVMLMWMKSF